MRAMSSSVLSIASSGLRAAQLRLDHSAHSVANWQTEGFAPQRVAQQSVEPQGGVQAAVAAPGPQGVSLEGEAVEQIVSAYAFKANALVLRTQDQMAGTLLDVLA